MPRAVAVAARGMAMPITPRTLSCQFLIGMPNAVLAPLTVSTRVRLAEQRHLVVDFVIVELGADNVVRRRPVMVVAIRLSYMKAENSAPNRLLYRSIDSLLPRR